MFIMISESVHVDHDKLLVLLPDPELLSFHSFSIVNLNVVNMHYIITAG